MRPYSSREARTDLAGWLLSAILHAMLLLIILVIAVPAGLHLAQPIQLVIGPAALPGAEIVVLDLTPDEGVSGVELIGASETGVADIPNLEVAHPTSGGGGAPSASGGRAAAAVRKGAGGEQQASFFGTIAQGDRFLFIVDVSSSMSQNGRKKRAFRELRNSIAQLASDQYFCVVLFSDEMRVMFELDAPQMFQATAMNRRRLNKWLRGVATDGGTNPRSSLAVGLGMTPSAIFMLSDGAFDGPEKASEFFGAAEPGIPELISKYDRAQTPIHTIALADPESKHNMAEIASLTGGRFRYVPRTDREYKEMSAERRAASWLRLAKNHESGGRTDLAEHYYRRIVSEYPATTVAEEIRHRD